MKKYYCFYCQKYVKCYRMFWWRVCANCHHYIVDDGNGFHKVCDKCKAKLPTDAAVCLKCGYHFSNRYAKKVYTLKKCPWLDLYFSIAVLAMFLVIMAFVTLLANNTNQMNFFRRENRIVAHFSIENDKAVISRQDTDKLAQKIAEFKQYNPDDLAIKIRVYTLPRDKRIGISCADAMKDYLLKQVFKPARNKGEEMKFWSQITYDICEYIPDLEGEKSKNCRNADDYTYLIKGNINLYVKSKKQPDEVVSVGVRCAVTLGADK